MMWAIIMQVALMGQKHGAPAHLKTEQWYYPIERITMRESRMNMASSGGKVFGSPALFEGSCPEEAGALKKQNCTIYYLSSLSGVKKGILRFAVKGEGKFRISVYSAAGAISREVELNGGLDTLEIDISRSIAITQHGGSDPLRIVFTPLTPSFSIEVSTFVLKQEE